MNTEIIQRAIDHWLKTGNNTLLVDEKPSLKEMWEKYSKEEGDTRSGAETYGYGTDEEIRDNMEYISDRWMCAFRIKWILDGLENGRI